MTSLIDVKPYKQPATHSVSCDECGEDGDGAEYVFGTNRFCRKHMLELMNNISLVVIGVKYSG